MPNPSKPILGVCSWSLRPTSAADLVEKVRAAGVRWVQLHLDPIRRGEWDLEGTRAALKGAGIGVASGMMSMKGEDYSTLESIRRTGGVFPNETWSENLSTAKANADVARKLEIGLVTFHAGFLPHERREWKSAVGIAFRLEKLARVFAAQNVRLALETGQEDASTLLEFLGAVDDLVPPNARVGVNFDPANMILYGAGDPGAAVRTLAARIVQVHVKDAVPTQTPGTWGQETRSGDGAVGWPGFLDVLRGAGVQCPLMIEREAGESRVEDVAHAARLIEGAGGLS